MSEYDVSYRELAQMWRAKDPMPAGLPEKVLVTLATEDLDAEYELMHLVERTTELAGARGDGEAVTISFAGASVAGGSFSLLLRVSAVDKKSCRVDGWVSPARPMKITIAQQAKRWEAAVDMFGRFEIPRLPTGLTRFWLLAADDSGDDNEHLFATPTVEL